MSAQDIARRADACLLRFRMLDDLNVRGDVPSSWLEEHRMLFSLWCSVLGVFADQKYSIAYRLRKNFAFSKAILQLLFAIEDNLNSLTRLFAPNKDVLSRQDLDESSDPGRAGDVGSQALPLLEDTYARQTTKPLDDYAISSSSSETSDESRNPVEADFESFERRIFEDISDLLRLATVIRQQSSSKRNQKADSFEPLHRDFPDDEDGDHSNETSVKRESLSSQFRRFADCIIRSEIGPETMDAGHRAYVAAILKSKMMLTWRRLCYYYVHHQKLRVQRRDLESSSLRKHAGIADVLNDVVQHHADYPKHIQAMMPLKGPGEDPLTTEAARAMTIVESAATTFPEDLSVGQLNRSKPTSSKATSRVDNINANLPPLPPVLDKADGKFFDCPYCGALNEAGKPPYKRAWKAHLWSHLTPYICLYEACNAAETEFSTLQEWKKHMEQHNDEFWLRGLCRGEDSPAAFQRQEYESQEALYQHYQTHHPEQIRSGEFSIILNYSRHVSRPKCCLVCDSEVGLISPTKGRGDSSGLDVEEQVLACMSSHLEALALSCLPWQTAPNFATKSDEAQGSNAPDVAEEQDDIDTIPSEATFSAITLRELKTAAAEHIPIRDREHILEWRGNTFDTDFDIEQSQQPDHAAREQAQIDQSEMHHETTAYAWERETDNDIDDSPLYGQIDTHISTWLSVETDTVDLSVPIGAPGKADPAGSLRSSSPLANPVVADDTMIRQEPSRHVDYLSHDWREEDLWASWRHIVSQRNVYGRMSRLENASWRAWAQSKNRLPKIDPQRLNWLKESDVTWLYGPLKPAKSHPITSDTSEEIPPLLSGKSSSINKKPILKKRSESEVMLQKSLANSSLVKQAAAAIQASERKHSQHSVGWPDYDNPDFEK